MKILVMAIVLTTAMAQTAAADLYLTCFSEDNGSRIVEVDEGWTNKMTVWNPNTPRIQIQKRADNISRGHFTAFENDAWRIIFDTNKGLGSLTNKVFGDSYACL